MVLFVLNFIAFLKFGILVKVTFLRISFGNLLICQDPVCFGAQKSENKKFRKNRNFFG